MRQFFPWLVLLLGACEPPKFQPPPTPIPTPAPTPAATPTPPPPPTPTPTPTIPRKPIDVTQLFNGITLFSKFETPQSEKPASIERDQEDSYKVQVTLTANLPNPSRTLEELDRNDPKLAEVLGKLARLLETARVSPNFEKLYKNKVDYLRERLNRLDLVLSRHNFYDCETILELQDIDTARKALLIQGDMDLNSDGSDGDRNFSIEASSPTFQPQTSYRWPKLTDRPNPVLPLYEKRLASLKQEFSFKGLPPERNRELKRSIDETNRVITELKSKSFLIADADPSIVVPGFMLGDNSDAFAPSIGDYAAVIYDGKIYPAIVGDIGPSNKVGEASARICREVNPRATGANRAVNSIKVTYLIFPGTAEKPGPPDLARWGMKCKQLLDEIGGTIPELYAWQNIVPPWPTPTPTPTPTPSPAPSSAPSSPSPAPSPIPSSPAPSPVAVSPPTSSPTVSSPVVAPTPTSSPAPTPPVRVPTRTPSPALGSPDPATTPFPAPTATPPAPVPTSPIPTPTSMSTSTATSPTSTPTSTHAPSPASTSDPSKSKPALTPSPSPAVLIPPDASGSATTAPSEEITPPPATKLSPSVPAPEVFAPAGGTSR